MDKRKTILLASDHNGNEARQRLFRRVMRLGHCAVDLGPPYDPMSLSVKKVDYTDYAQQVAMAVSLNPELRGILICGTGIGMSIAANRVMGVKASLVCDVHTARKTREHNDSNVLVLGAWTTGAELQEDILEAWLGQEFGHGRHETRVAQLDNHSPEDVVLVPGVFEIVHAGHIKLFKFARQFGRVVVALNTDNSAELVKGRRPKVSQVDRAEVISRIDCVDEVILMDGTSAKFLYEQTGARYIVKGGQPGDEKSVVANDGVQEESVKLFPIDHGHSTRAIRESFSDG